AVAQLHAEAPLAHEEQLVLDVVLGPHEGSEELDELPLLAVQPRDDARVPVIAEQGELLGEVDLVHAWSLDEPACAGHGPRRSKLVGQPGDEPPPVLPDRLLAQLVADGHAVAPVEDVLHGDLPAQPLDGETAGAGHRGGGRGPRRAPRGRGGGGRPTPPRPPPPPAPPGESAPCPPRRGAASSCARCRPRRRPRSPRPPRSPTRPRPTPRAPRARHRPP